MDRQVIALIGYRNAGKGMAARHLTRDRGFSILNMAAPVERMLEAGLGIDPSVFQHDAQRLPLEGAGGCTPAELKNSLFHDWGRRGVHGTLWAKGWRRLLRSSAAPRVLVKDACYPAELREIKDAGGVIWRIERPGVEPSRPADAALAGVVADHTIINRGDDPAVLYRLLDLGLQSLGGEA